MAPVTPGSAAHLQALNARLADVPYLSGMAPGREDAATLAALAAAGVDVANADIMGPPPRPGGVHKPALPHVLRWLKHMGSFTPAQRAGWA